MFRHTLPSPTTPVALARLVTPNALAQLAASLGLLLVAGCGPIQVEDGGVLHFEIEVIDGAAEGLELEFSSIELQPCLSEFEDWSSLFVESAFAHAGERTNGLTSTLRVPLRPAEGNYPWGSALVASESYCWAELSARLRDTLTPQDDGRSSLPFSVWIDLEDEPSFSEEHQLTVVVSLAALTGDTPVPDLDRLVVDILSDASLVISDTSAGANEVRQ